jgi:hypothetical protein
MTPFSVTFGTDKKGILSDIGTYFKPCYWIGVLVTSMGTAGHIYVGDGDAQLIDFTAVGSYQEFGVEGRLINAADIFVRGDVGATCTVLITGYEAVDLGGVDKSGGVS